MARAARSSFAIVEKSFYANFQENSTLGMPRFSGLGGLDLSRRRPLGALPRAAGGTDQNRPYIQRCEPVESARVLHRHADHGDLPRRPCTAFRLHSVLVFEAAYLARNWSITSRAKRYAGNRPFFPTPEIRWSLVSTFR